MVPIAPVMNAGWVDDASLLPPPPPLPPHPAITSMTTASTTVPNRFIVNPQLPRSGVGPAGVNSTFCPAKIASNDSCAVEGPAVTTIPYVPGCGSDRLMLIATGIFTDAVLGTSGAV